MEIIAILIRVVVLVVAIPLSGWVFAAATGGPDANIGAGLFAFAVAIVVAGIWGLVDGRRARSPGPLLLRWVLVAVLAVLAPMVLSVVRNSTEGVTVAESAFLALFFLGLIAAPALVGVAIGSALRSPEAGQQPG